MRALGVLALSLFASQCVGLQIVVGAPANPLGRALKICELPEMGFMMSTNSTGLSSWSEVGTHLARDFSNSITSDSAWMKPVILSDALGNLGLVKGFDVDFIRHIVHTTLAWTYEIHIYPTYAAAFYHAMHGECDMVFGAFNRWPQRLQCHATPVSGESWGSATGCPYYLNPANATTTSSFWTAGCCGTPIQDHQMNGLAIMAHVPFKSSSEKMVDTITGPFVGGWIVNLSLGIFFFGHIIWFLERNRESVDGNDTPQFPLSLTQGGQEGVWWALVTTTTVGYGDRTIKQGFARLVGAAWMLFGFIAMACIIGALASSLTDAGVHAEILTTAGLKGKKVCTYTAYVKYITQHGGSAYPAVGTEKFDECYSMLKANTVDAIINDQLILGSARIQDNSLAQYSVGNQFTQFSQGGFVSSHHDLGCPDCNHKVLDRINWAINKLLLTEASIFRNLQDTWIAASGNPHAEEDGIWLPELILAYVCWAGFLLLQILSMNNPWTEWLREKIPTCGGCHDFVFGTNDERRLFYNYTEAAKNSWFRWLPDWSHPTPEDDRGIFHAPDCKSSSTGWRNQIAAHFREVAASGTPGSPAIGSNSTRAQAGSQAVADAKVHPEPRNSAEPEAQTPVQDFKLSEESLP